MENNVIKYSIIRSKRKTLALTINKDGEVIARAPMRMSEEKISDFVRKKSHWIKKAIYKTQQNIDFKNSFDFKNKVYILGKVYNIEDMPQAKKILNKGDVENKIDTFEHFYRGVANDFLPKKAKEISQITGLMYKTLKISKSKRCWGSYSKDGIMKLNYKLIVLPQPLINYVIVHELCHSKHLNHSQRFWNLVGKFVPNYYELREELNRYGFLL